MAKKKILLVGEFMNTDMWEQDLGEKYETHSVSTVVEAIDFLKANPDTELFVQENLPLRYPSATPIEYPPESALDKVMDLDRGEVLIQYARANRLISDQTPAYLATVFEKFEKFEDKPEGVTNVIRLMSERGIVDQMTPPLFREQDAAQAQRG